MVCSDSMFRLDHKSSYIMWASSWFNRGLLFSSESRENKNIQWPTLLRSCQGQIKYSMQNKLLICYDPEIKLHSCYGGGRLCYWVW